MTAAPVIDRRGILLSRNLGLTATLTSSVAWATPLANVLDPALKQRVARYTGGGVADILVTLARREAAVALLLIAYDLRGDAQWRVTWYSDRAATMPREGASWASLWSAPVPPHQPLRLRPVSMRNWMSGRPDVPPGGKVLALDVLHQQVPVGAVQVEIDNKGAPFDLSWLMVGAGLRPRYNYELGRIREPDIRTPVETLPSGRRLYGRPLVLPRQTVTYSDLSHDEARQVETLASATQEPVALIADPGADPRLRAWETTVGNLEPRVRLVDQDGDGRRWSVTLTVVGIAS